ncbi:MAG: molybdopterin-dependent oxidoreductase, partial [Deltaproteobacteria bacterium]|nr:molybdopterin-dependent oxidoreductase [Deltaproteobacteria bacterium]
SLRDAAAPWTPERVRETAGVGPEALTALAETYGRKRPSATLIGIGLQKCARGADQVRAVSFIPALLGIHRGFFYSNGDGFPVETSLISGKALARRPARIVHQVALGETVRAGAFKLIYVSGMNPAATLPDQNAFREGIGRKDVFLAVHETHWSKTAAMADLVLPAPTYLEKEDLVLPWTHDLVRISPRVVLPVTDSRSEIRVMQETARLLGLREDRIHEDAWRAVLTALQDALTDGDFESLLSGKTLRLKGRGKDAYPTPSGKIEFSSSRARKNGFDPLPGQSSPPVEEEEDFLLLSSAVPHYTHTQFQEVYGPIPSAVAVHPSDAKRLRIEAGDRVVLSNDLGRVAVKAEISDRVPVGVLWCPRQSETPEGVAMNSLAGGDPQGIGGGPRFNSTRVRVSRG